MLIAPGRHYYLRKSEYVHAVVFQCRQAFLDINTAKTFINAITCLQTGNGMLVMPADPVFFLSSLNKIFSYMYFLFFLVQQQYNSKLVFM